MRSGGNDDNNNDSGNTKEHVLIKHVIRGRGSSLALKEAVYTINSTQNIDGREGEGEGGGTKTESGDGVITTSKMRFANNDDDGNVDAGPKEPQKVEDVVAFVNQLNMDELLAQQLAGENLPLVDASSLPPETTNTSVDKEDSTVM
ncbi:hypothetical protein RFI_35994, partial [Reticulomyxa filosa]